MPAFHHKLPTNSKHDNTIHYPPSLSSQLIMLNLYPRLSASWRSRNGDGDSDSDGDGDNEVAKLRAFYGIAVACVAVLLFCCMLGATASVLKAGAFAATAGLLLVVLGCLAPRTLWLRRRRAERPVIPVLPLTTARGGCACAPADVPAAFAYLCPLEEGSCGDDGEETVPAYVVICPVCLEGVHGGEMVRQLPACRHVFHMECIDMWLHSHRTCPMCRSVISPPTVVAAKASEPEETSDSSDEALPPV